MEISARHKRSFSFLVALLFWYFNEAWSWTHAKETPQVRVPCFFIFGDSLVDNGNNNDILTLARANYQPYGVDFPQGPTGRFSNGRTVVDVLAQLVGFSTYIPPHSETSRRSVIAGANFASGAAGIRDETGNNLGAHIPMNQQLSNFEGILPEIRRYLGGDMKAVENHLSKCIFYSGMGSNDYLNNYFMTNYYTTSSQFTPTAYANALLQDYSRQLAFLYQLGGRKVIVAGVGQIGCIPYELARYNSTDQSRCNEDKNNAVNLFNSGLRQLVDVFNHNNAQFPGAKFVYLDSYLSSRDLYSKPKTYGFDVVDKACCGVGKNNGQITCLPFQEPCENRSKYLFWDAFHPTEIANVLLAKKAFTTKNKSYAYPINIQQLATL
ncbi:hypothetical protein Cgig2_013480 [Carnegiea gigantea]|uniref:Uncharacterized protein n=1 Tax=Carnegiea gigantea TaxID=171969 RepID=A0A9Q1QCB6_9CARY|nr:hypothetical protein Cgig2_013480 [Carnegiea gigantea]